MATTGKNRKLTPKQKRFCQEYMIDLNGTQSAIRAGYSKKTANEQSSQLLTKLNIQAEIRKLRAERSERTGITADMVLKERARLGFSNMSDYATWGESGFTLTDSDILTEEQTACISEVSETITKDGGTIKFKLHDKKAALELLGRHLGIFEKDNKQSRAVIVYKIAEISIPDDAGISK